MALVFISYSPTDRDPYLERFFLDLQAGIAGLTGLAPDHVCYWERQPEEVGDEWSPETTQQLRTAAVLVPICSPAYFNSSRRGKEFQAFLLRTASEKTESREDGGAIVPVFWYSPRGAIPEPVAALRDDKGLPDLYIREGLRYLTRLNKFKHEYARFVERLAEKVTAASRGRSAVEITHRLNIASLANAFEPSKASASKKDPVVVGGPQVADFIYVAGARTALAPIRKSVESYGVAEGRSWRPFNEPAHVVGQLAASSLNLYYRELSLEEAFPKGLQTALDRGEVVMMLVDVWSLLIDTYAERLREYDALNLPNCGLVIPWNDDDAETLAERDRLIAVLRQTLPVKTSLGLPAHDWTSVHSPSALMATLQRNLTVLRMRIITQANAVRRIEDPALSLKARELGIRIDSLPILTNQSGDTQG